MKTLQTLALTATILGGAVSTVNAQYVGAACGCPPLASRTEVLLTTRVDADGNFLDSTEEWNCQNMYINDFTGPIYVGASQTLTIGPGTVIKSEDGTGLDASSLVVARDGQIFAEGTDECKIVFTSVNDVNVDGSFAVTNTAQWGGLLILGRAKNNLVAGNIGAGSSFLAVAPGLGRIEGLDFLDPRNVYGADLTGATGPAEAFDDNDNSGVLRHVSVRHGGVAINANNEVNGITLGSVGRGTIIENVEVVANEDDGIEFFGGTANMKYASALFCKDDGFDTDQAYTGNIQFGFIVQLTNTIQGDHILEIDGEDNNIATTDLGNQQFWNITGIGNNNAGDPAVEAKENWRGTVANSVFVNTVIGVRIAPNVVNAFLVDESANFFNNTFDAVPDLVNFGSGEPNPSGETLFTANQNITEAGVVPDFTYDSTVPGSGVYAIPPAGLAGNPSFAIPAGITPTSYRGAFKPGEGVPSWIAGSYIDEVLGAFDSASCRSDLDGNGLINVSDFQIFGSDFSVGSCE
jgi:hypothetical protein